jgi:Predicted hydrolase (HAD superfamily)
MGASKPSPEAFMAAARGLGVEVEEMAHVGDRASEDLGGALAAGLRAVLVARGRVREAAVFEALGFAVVPDLRGLGEVLRRLGAKG